MEIVLNETKKIYTFPFMQLSSSQKPKSEVMLP